MKEEDLQDPSQWDFENAQELPAERRARAVVSVALSRSDLMVISQAARDSGMKLSQYIREAALQAAMPRRVASMMKRTETKGRWTPTPDIVQQATSSGTPPLQAVV
jgi:predicted DNA binding CopG/RHH family protein